MFRRPCTPAPLSCHAFASRLLASTLTFAVLTTPAKTPPSARKLSRGIECGKLNVSGKPVTAENGGKKYTGSLFSVVLISPLRGGARAGEGHCPSPRQPSE